MKILGISALYHDSAACLVIDGDVVSAIQQERISRVKHDLSFPLDAINECLSEGGISSEALDLVVFYDNPLLTLDRYLCNVYACGPDAGDLLENGYNSLVGDKLWIHNVIRQHLKLSSNAEIYVCEHHMSHAASAFYPSPFNEAVILTLDGVGEWATTTIGVGHGTKIELFEELRYPHSLGLLYSAFTYYCGFKVNSGDYKFMGLAPYGEPKYEQLIRDEIIDIKDDGSFRLNLDYFDYQYGRTMINDKFECLFGKEKRKPESRITQHEMDVAASAQKVVEDVIIRIAKHAKREYGKGVDNIVLAGGVALNCVANGKLKNENIFKNIWIQPAAGDAGGALGCALYAAYSFGEDRKVNLNDSQKGSFLGNSYSEGEVESFLIRNNFPFHRMEGDRVYESIAKEIAQQKVVGLFQGRMEFGPRALGNRSIIADARSEEMQTQLNLKIKFRESFRPFAPAVLYDDVSKYFELEDESPYMLIVENVRDELREKNNFRELLKGNDGDMLEVVKQKRSSVPAITHVDYSARIQTVTEGRNPYLWNVMQCFKKLTGSSVIVNTSFNVRGEPIVCTLNNAYDCFMRTEMDVLVLESFVLYKEEQPQWEETDDWKNKYVLD